MFRTNQAAKLLMLCGTALMCTPTCADELTPDWTELDITDELQQAIFDAPAEGRRIILKNRDRSYFLCRPVVIAQDNIHLIGETKDDGDASTLDPPLTRIKGAVFKNWSGFPILFAVLGVKNCSIQDLRINGNVLLQKPQGGQHTIVMAGTEDCLIKNLDMWNVGLSTEVPRGSCVILTAVGIDEPHPIPRLHRNIFIRTPFGEEDEGENYDLRQSGKPSRNNKVTHCAFDGLTPQFEMQGSFGVRVLTSWWADKEHDEFTTLASGNRIVNNWFEGWYDSALEIAGPGSQKNLVSRNFVRNGFQTAIEADKGASYNDFQYNTVKTHWTLKHANGISPDEPSDARAYPYRDQGFSKPDIRVRFARGNRYRWNKALRVVGRSRKKTGLFLLNRSINVVLRGNYLGTIERDDPNENEMYSVSLDHYVEGARFNVVKGVGSNSLPRHDKHGNKLELFLHLDDVEVVNPGSKNGFEFRE